MGREAWDSLKPDRMKGRSCSRSDLCTGRTGGHVPWPEWTPRERAGLWARAHHATSPKRAACDPRWLHRERLCRESCAEDERSARSGNGVGRPTRTPRVRDTSVCKEPSPCIFIPPPLWTLKEQKAAASSRKGGESKRAVIPTTTRHGPPLPPHCRKPGQHE